MTASLSGVPGKDSSVCMRACVSVFMGLHLYADHVVSGLIPSSVTECDWHSDACGWADVERGAAMLSGKREIMLWH